MATRKRGCHIDQVESLTRHYFLLLPALISWMQSMPEVIEFATSTCLKIMHASLVFLTNNMLRCQFVLKREERCLFPVTRDGPD